ncbi:MAG: methyltransferase domain-containing protein [Candidatus Levybacteria bacterium]|nr:methyltransferase domain-containing protein [Candidatus Levybacteria bacterium]
MTVTEQVDRRGPSGPKFHDESLMPVTMGTPYRVPDYAYPNWGLVYEGEEKATAAYRAEWAEGNKDQLGLVTRAIVEAGYGNFPALLRESAARAIRELVTYRGESVKILDIGAGPGTSADEVYEALDSVTRSHTDMYLVDPSPDSLVDAKVRLEGKGRFNFFLQGSDSDMLPNIDSNTFDVVLGVASVHHHAKIPFEEYNRVLKPGGFLVLADWHQPLWEHPGSVFDFLEQIDWPRKEEGLDNWLRVYPKAVNMPPPPRNPADRQAIIEITEFWKAYQRISREANLGPNAIWPLEGHRPVARYVKAMKEAGFDLETPDIDRLIRNGVISRNPHQILPDSSLLQLSVAQKPRDHERTARIAA